ncbi:preprotein translocase subunit SecG [Sinimarinibacterium sp. CAU 1509]|uniref:preprotein translocase subunit SecG n=1 Tax=Sinimarinibacterium sp. CAU 1509 TaxID=2562283 RepID=UPI0010ACB4A3|nr:preprotein translocase subunit SecG [Sinimarinibacterium sp. CAU 1509]TJY62172.1 preprotein translocase subunit SecG [Sinimarinibacterium sp. CAU 1509]
MYTILVIVQVLVALALVGLILIQHGKGADAGAAFGSGASGTVFGARGSANFLSRTTGWLATIFFAVSLALAYLVHGEKEGTSVLDTVPAAAELPAQAGDASSVPVEIPAESAPDQAPVVPE